MCYVGESYVYFKASSFLSKFCTLVKCDEEEDRRQDSQLQLLLGLVDVDPDFKASLTRQIAFNLRNPSRSASASEGPASLVQRTSYAGWSHFSMRHFKETSTLSIGSTSEMVWSIRTMILSRRSSKFHMVARCRAAVHWLNVGAESSYRTLLKLVVGHQCNQNSLHDMVDIRSFQDV